MPNNQSEESKNFAVKKHDYNVIDFASLHSRKKYEHVCCVITDYFPNLKQEESALLVYLDVKSEINVQSRSGDRKGLLLQHLTPWLPRNTIEQVIEFLRFAVCILSEDNQYLYLSETCHKFLIEQNISFLALPRWKKVLTAENSCLTKDSFRFIPIQQTQIFNPKQQVIASSISQTVLMGKIELNDEHLLAGGMFFSSDPKVPLWQKFTP
jgi:hypothetical protein